MPKTIFAIISSYVEGDVQKTFKTEFDVFSWLPSLQNMHVSLEHLLQSKFWNHFQEETVP